MTTDSPLSPAPEADSPAEATRRNLIAAGFALFGTEGYAGTSTRRLAQHAGTNVASIAYHFGGKAGLHEACAHAAAARIAQAVGAPRDHGAISPEAALATLEATLRGLAAMLLTGGEEVRAMVGFLVRELSSGERIVEVLYDDLIGPKHRELCILWATATGQDPDSEAVRLSVFATIGQALYFRIGQPVVRRAMGWETVGPNEAARIADTLVAQLRAAIERSRI